MKRRRGRKLTDDEIALWQYVARSVRPLPGHAVPDVVKPPEEDKSADANSQSEKAAEKIIAVPVKKKQPREPAPLPLVPVDRRQMRDLRRGVAMIEGRIDLHGMRQAEAHVALGAFLRRQQIQGARIVLVVTGKGSSVANVADPFNERGVLRRLVPQWLSLPDMRMVVLGYSTASREHGGDGALYVRLRRAGKGSPHR